MTSTREFIKNIIKNVDKHGKGLFKTRPGFNLTLQTEGCREYFDGNFQLLQYERVRQCLRKKTKMKLVLTQIPKNYNLTKFPPLYRQNMSQLHKQAKQGKNKSLNESSQDMKDELSHFNEMVQIFHD